MENERVGVWLPVDTPTAGAKAPTRRESPRPMALDCTSEQRQAAGPMSADFLDRSLPDGHRVQVGRLPRALLPDAAGLAALWALHPPEYHEIVMHGRRVATPRWQQAYGADYHYTGRVNRAEPLTPAMTPFLAWAREVVDTRLNGLLFNWYDAERAHYIGKHRDSTKDMIEGAPIVTISLGATRLFRLRPWRGAGKIDLEADHGAVIVIPQATNLAWTHEVPHRAADLGRRISITLRGFVQRG
jgi:alkylated DNA repair dioxygenase AlkB